MLALGQRVSRPVVGIRATSPLIASTSRAVSLPVRHTRSVLRYAKPLEQEVEGCDYIVQDLCEIDPETGNAAPKRSVGEMEQLFLQALGAYYYGGERLISDDEFNTLKEELIWSGSKIAIMDGEEQRFLEATISYNKGKGFMSDEEYDALKTKLRNKGSVVAAQGPRCSIRSKKMYSNADLDYLRMTALNVPAVLLVLGLVFTLDDLTGFEITQAIELPPPWGVALLWGLLLPFSYIIASTVTNIAFKDAKVLKGPCPNCNQENITFFGDVMTVSGNRGQNIVNCTNCNASLTFDENKRVIVVSEGPSDRPAAPAGAKKKGAGAKKKAAADEA